MSLVTLARQILKDAEALEAGLQNIGLQPCTFDVDSPPVIPEQFVHIQQSILIAADELQALTAGPLQFLIRTISPVLNVFVAAQTIARFKIAHQLKPDELISFDLLAQRCGIPTSDATRVLRLAIANRIFDEPKPGLIRHNATSRLFTDMPDLISWIRFFTDEILPSVSRTADAMERWPGSQELNQTGFSLAKDTGGTFFESLKSSPERRVHFDGCMRFLRNTPDLHPSFLLDNLDWQGEERCPGTVVDMGGSSGHIAKAMLGRFPIKRCIVQDLPEVAADGQVPADLEGRLEFQVHDFFNPQPVEADVYYLRSVLHDFPDKYAQQVLRAIVPAMKPGAKILLNEACMAEAGQLPKYAEQLYRGFDITMKSIFNSQEREIGDWKRLAQAAHADLRVSSTKIIPGSALAIIEIARDDTSSANGSTT